MVVLSSPSGAGKTTLSKLLSKNKNFHISVSHTTRKPRINEIDGKEYYFVNKDQFKLLIDKNEFLEYAKVFHHYYGTSKPFVIESLEKGKNVVFDIDWQGTEQIKEKKSELKILYDSPRDIFTLERVGKWSIIQIAKLFLGLPIIPGK